MAPISLFSKRSALTGPDRRLQVGEEVEIAVFVKQRLGQDKLLGREKRRITQQCQSLYLRGGHANFIELMNLHSIRARRWADRI